jgi:hypothetical protein
MDEDPHQFTTLAHWVQLSNGTTWKLSKALKKQLFNEVACEANI